MNDNFLPLEEGEYYHIYNRGNNKCNIFYKHENYRYFLQKYDEYLSDYVETYAYSLLPNHFHLVIRVKERDSIRQSADGISIGSASEQFRKFFIAYSMAINKQQKRTGSLFQKNFKRKKVDSDSYFTQLIYYVHANPMAHGLCDDFRVYPYSSYLRILNDKPTKLFKKEVLNWFGGKEEYIRFHEIMARDLLEIRYLVMED